MRVSNVKRKDYLVKRKSKNVKIKKHKKITDCFTGHSKGHRNSGKDCLVNLKVMNPKPRSRSARIYTNSVKRQIGIRKKNQ